MLSGLWDHKQQNTLYDIMEYRLQFCFMAINMLLWLLVDCSFIMHSYLHTYIHSYFIEFDFVYYKYCRVSVIIINSPQCKISWNRPIESEIFMEWVKFWKFYGLGELKVWNFHRIGVLKIWTFNEIGRWKVAVEFLG